MKHIAIIILALTCVGQAFIIVAQRSQIRTATDGWKHSVESSEHATQLAQECNRLTDSAQDLLKKALEGVATTEERNGGPHWKIGFRDGVKWATEKLLLAASATHDGTMKLSEFGDALTRDYPERVRQGEDGESEAPPPDWVVRRDKMENETRIAYERAFESLGYHAQMYATNNGPRWCELQPLGKSNEIAMLMVNSTNKAPLAVEIFMNGQKIQSFANVVEIVPNHDEHCHLVRYVQDGRTNDFHAWLAEVRDAKTHKVLAAAPNEEETQKALHEAVAVPWKEQK